MSVHSVRGIRASVMVSASVTVDQGYVRHSVNGYGFGIVVTVSHGYIIFELGATLSSVSVTVRVESDATLSSVSVVMVEPGFTRSTVRVIKG